MRITEIMFMKHYGTIYINKGVINEREKIQKKKE